MELEGSFYHYKENFYSRWQKNIIRLCLIAAFIILGIEIFTYFSLLTVAEREIRKFSYIFARIVVPSTINFGSLITASIICKSKKVKVETKNLLVSISFFLICSVLSIFHNYFQLLLTSTCIALFLCTIFGDEKILKILAIATIPSFIIACITFWTDELSGIAIYKLLTYICAIAFIICSLLFARAIVYSQKGQLKYISSIYEKQTELIEELRIDPLTKLCNRIAFSETMNRIIRHSKELDISPFIVMMDIDFFKKVNDKYGHIAGDEVLVGLADIMRSNVPSRKVFRFGGEEFILLFENDTEESVVSIVERIRKEFADKRYDFAPDSSFKISAGISALSPSFDEKAWIENADKALYYAKENGRNQIKIADI